jgi:ribosomal-protein-alanine N-acetyltransferase
MLETNRLILRKLTPDDAEALYRIYHEPGVLKYFSHGPPDSIEAETAGIRRHLLHYEEHGFGLWATVLRTSGELIGRCGLLAQQVNGAAETEVAYLLSRRFWGQGLASEAARAIRDLAFSRLGQSRLVSMIHPCNTASKRVAGAIGMTFCTMTRGTEIPLEVFCLAKPADSTQSACLP